jgi:hypothetical protein
MQAQERPRFRQDLVAELIEEQGARFIDVMDPDSDSVFRFYEVEYALACAMDGERDVAGIVKWAQEELGVTPSPKEVQSVIATLVDLKFIDTAAPAADAKVAKAAQPAQPAPAAAAAATPAPVAKVAPTDTELARGVVVGQNIAAKSTHEAAADLELGGAGSKAQHKAVDLPAAPDFALGSPGAAPIAAPAKAPVEDIALGAPGAREAAKPAPAKPVVSEVSIDLAAHMPVGAADVKDAVKQSKVMSAVDVPKELLAAEAKPAETAEKPVEAKSAKQLEREAQSARDKQAAKDKKEAEAKAAVAKAEQAGKTADKADKAADKADKKADKAEKKAEKATASAAVDRAAANKAADTASTKSEKADKATEKTAEKKADKGKPAVELPKRPGTGQPIAPPAPRAGVSPVLVVMLILALVGAGAFFVWKFVINKPETAAQVAPTPPPRPLPPPPPAESLAKVGLETPAPQDVKAPAAGTIETIEAADKEVKTGDVVATLAGGKPLTTEIANLTKDIERLTPATEAALKTLTDAQQKPDNEAAVTAAQKKYDTAKKPLDAKKATLETKKADLEKLQIKTVTDGKLTDVAKVGQKVAADEVIAKVARPAMNVATFKLLPGQKLSSDNTLNVTAGDKQIACTVIDAQAETVKVSCPADGIAEGTELKYTLPK